MTRIDWPPVVEHAAEIVDSYDTSVTLPELFYRLVADGTLPNTQTAYKTLSDRTAVARREDRFPELVDETRGLVLPLRFDGPAQALHWPARQYLRGRTHGQPFDVLLAVEKRGLVQQLDAWFGDLGVPILALAGYVSESCVSEARRYLRRRGTPSVLLYAGDFDASGEDLFRDFVERAGCFDEVRRVALTEEQVEAYGLPEFPGKKSDPRARGFEEKYGRLVQVELDALDPNDLRALYQEALNEFWDVCPLERAVAKEGADWRIKQMRRVCIAADRAARGEQQGPRMADKQLKPRPARFGWKRGDTLVVKRPKPEPKKGGTP